MSFTILRVNENGVLLYAQHEKRFRKAGKEAMSMFRKYAYEAVPGIYNLYWDPPLQTMHVIARGESRLFDGMPVRFLVSPLADAKKPIDKPFPPSPYTYLVKPGFATLLTSFAGTEIYESCRASVIAWNGKQIIMVPEDRPRVKSTMEEMLKGLGIRNYELGIKKGEALITEEPIMKDSDYPIALINAVKCICTVSIEGRKPFPAEQIEKIREIYLASARRE